MDLRDCKFVLVGALLVASASVARAQDKEIDMTPPTPASGPVAPDVPFQKGTLGLSFPITLLTNVAGSVLGSTVERVQTLDLVYFLSDKAAVDLIAGVNFHRQQTTDANGNTVDTNLFGFAAGLGYRLYSSKNNLRSFVEPQVVLSWPDTADSTTFTLQAGAEFGLERNLTPWLSLSGAVGAALAFTDSFKDIQIATQANLAANLYWH